MKRQRNSNGEIETLGEAAAAAGKANNQEMVLWNVIVALNTHAKTLRSSTTSNVASAGMIVHKRKARKQPIKMGSKTASINFFSYRRQSMR